jgi:RNA-binding protein NOB1
VGMQLRGSCHGARRVAARCAVYHYLCIYVAGMSWAAIAQTAPPPTQAPLAPALDVTQKDLRVVVVDANAIISGIRLEGVADKAVTIPEVLQEIRDKQSRQFLATLPFRIDVHEPTEESLAAGG